MALKELHKTLQSDDLCLVYSGIFSDSMTDKIIDLSSVYLENNPELSKMRKRTSFLVAECFQNVVRHGSKSNSTDTHYLSSGSFLVRFRENKCFIASRNAVPNDQVDELHKKIEDINSRSEDELKARYKGILAEGNISEKGGAGLGLIEMARKTKNKLHYCFDKIDNEFCEFYLMLILEQNEKDAPGRVYVSELNTIIEIFKKDDEENLFMLYQGDYGDLVINPVIDMIQNTMDSISTSMATRMKLYHAAIEMMHNINNYSYTEDGKKMGMLTMGKLNQSPIISAHYSLRCSSRQKMKKILESFKNASPVDLDQRYTKKLRISRKSNSENNWIGLIELARISHSWDFELEDIDDTLCNLGLQVTI
jgi:hypothetical protein